MKSFAIMAAGAGVALAQSVTTTIPDPAGTSLSPEPITVSDSFDGGNFLYDRDSVVCQGQTETGRDDTIFILEDGASISNVIIGPNQAEGIHCLGACTITNVWFQEVCEDAITLEGDGSITISGGGAFNADDKVIQLNGLVDVSISDYYVQDYGKLSRSCGNCEDNVGPRKITIDNVVAKNGGVLCGINSNYGDTCTITNSCVDSGDSCAAYEGNDTGDEPTKISDGPDGTYCIGDVTTSC